MNEFFEKSSVLHEHIEEHGNSISNVTELCDYVKVQQEDLKILMEKCEEDLKEIAELLDQTFPHIKYKKEAKEVGLLIQEKLCPKLVIEDKTFAWGCKEATRWHVNGKLPEDLEMYKCDLFSHNEYLTIHNCGEKFLLVDYNPVKNKIYIGFEYDKLDDLNWGSLSLEKLKEWTWGKTGPKRAEVE